METKWCPGFGRSRHEVSIAEFYANRGRHDGLSPLCVDCHRADNNARRRRDRQKLIDAMGGVCERCGFDDERALQVDHVNSDGALERADKQSSHGPAFLRRILNERSRYMLLCANCNWIKKAEMEEWRQPDSYLRTVPTERKKGPGKGGSESGKAAIQWENFSKEKQAEIIAKRSEARRKKRQRALEAEADMEPHPSWADHGLTGCIDCGRHVPPLQARGMCRACYMRDYNKNR